MRLLDLSLGHPRYGWPKEAQSGAAKWVLQEDHGYPSPSGSLALREAIVRKLKAYNGYEVGTEQVVISTGGSSGIMACLDAVCEPGDSVLVPDPGFPLYRLMCRQLRLRLIPYPLHAELGYRPDLDEIDTLVEANTKAIIWNSPGNPVGQVCPPEELRRMAEWVEKTGLYCISDEVYETLIYDGEHASPVTLGDPNRFFSVYSFSKSYGMADLRIGYVACPKSMAAAVTRHQWASTMGVNRLSQAAALAAASADDSYHVRLREQLRRVRDRAAEELNRWEVPYVMPSAAFYFWMKIDELGLEAEAFTERLYQEQRVLLSPGDDFGKKGRGHVRLSFAEQPETVLEAVSRLGAFYQGVRSRRG